MVRARGGEGSVPSVIGGSKVGVGEGQVKDRGSRHVSKGEVGANTRLVEEGEVVVGCEVEIWVGEV